MLNAKPESVLALDYGEKRVGVAVSSVLARLAHPLTTLSNNEQLLDNLQQIIQEENIICVVVGYPRGMEGQITQQTRLAEAFANQLKQKLKVRVELQDESLTSVKAENELAKKAYTKAEIDALSATYILSDWLDLHANIGKLS